jgi:hypothetical protein
MSNVIPESEVNWLQSLNTRFKERMPNGTDYIYSFDILPPTLRAFVKSRNRDTEYICMGPSSGSKRGTTWSIWGWTSLPKSPWPDNADWNTTILAEKPLPSKEEIDKKLQKIQAELTEVSEFIKLLL